MHTENNQLFAVINPVAGSCDAETVQHTLTKACTNAGFSLECHFTSIGEKNEDIIHAVRQAVKNRCSRVVAAGGDGTIAAVGSGLVDTGIPLAILPVGTANLLARELDIPFDLSTACQLAVNGDKQRRLDAMRVGEQYFLSHISLGVYSKIAERTSRAAKRHFRQVAYIWNALPELLSGRTWRMALTVDDQKILLHASFIMIANVGGLGAAELRWGENILLDDGHIDICVVHARTLKDYLMLANSILWRRHKLSPKLTYYRATRNIQVTTTSKRVPVRGDGEIIGHSAVEITLVPAAIRIITPTTAEHG
ncbi:lipid kinase, YegS/Rv2252/BmrU family [Nitrosomonas sp. Nm51]|uniref:diacylglycerol/lipid kinase family protein n=1 Tax=Nitrosomonas sp. Nm51 TaxID=133720 RepID=UPI0008CB58DE|nr:diacylglycerol kinase family protein [Nitrosomonas sp. Nm51]SEQ74588.1 lipid kinase, YegS/Rv2252/BmrU family [Nitrosomonas sp. Nm51]